MALYLCKMDPNTYPAEPTLIGIVGVIVEARDWEKGVDGYRFIPHVSGRKTSRRVWPTVNDSIPAWVENVGFTRLLDGDELKAAQQRELAA